MATSPDTTYYGKGFQTPGLGSVGAYQVSGVPFMTGDVVAHTAEVKIDFPNVTRSITVINKDASGNDAIKVHFAPAADAYPNLNYITLDAKNSSVTMNVKARTIWILRS